VDGVKPERLANGDHWHWNPVVTRHAFDHWAGRCMQPPETPLLVAAYNRSGPVARKGHCRMIWRFLARNKSNSRKYLRQWHEAKGRGQAGKVLLAQADEIVFLAKMEVPGSDRPVILTCVPLWQAVATVRDWNRQRGAGVAVRGIV
jgi:hypothetical protein